jgi:hypothetical protein
VPFRSCSLHSVPLDEGNELLPGRVLPRSCCWSTASHSGPVPSSDGDSGCGVSGPRGPLDSTLSRSMDLTSRHGEPLQHACRQQM